MTPISSAVSSGFTWSKLPRNRGDELRLRGEVVGTLRRPSMWSSNFEATTVDGIWSIRQRGFWRTGVEIVDPASQQAIATFASGWGERGTLTFADGQSFRFECSGFWRPVWRVTTATGQPVLALHASKKIVEVPAEAVADSRLPLLVLFALYRMRQSEEDATAAAVVAVTS